jgi:hypothetical protein
VKNICFPERSFPEKSTSGDTQFETIFGEKCHLTKTAPTWVAQRNDSHFQCQGRPWKFAEALIFAQNIGFDTPAGVCYDPHSSVFCRTERKNR